jgi:acetylornithine deacetylase
MPFRQDDAQMVSDSIVQETIALLQALIAIPSLSGKEDKVADHLEAHLQSNFPGHVKRLGNNLIVECTGKEAGNTLLLCSHIDTVAPAAGWTRDPFAGKIEDNKIYGLGANDAGASVVSMIAAAKLLAPKLPGKLILCLAAEEEAGSQGFFKIEADLPRYDAAIFGEPTGLGVARGMRGSMRAVMRSHGVACHASRPWEGKNACDQFAQDLKTLRTIDLKDQSAWGCATIEPTVVRGGESTNQIPGLIETTLDIRTTPDKDNRWIEAELKKSGLDITITINRRHPIVSDRRSQLIEAIWRARPGSAEYVFNGTCDMAFSTAASVVMGPGKSERSHAADEFISKDELKEAIDTYTSVVETYMSICRQPVGQS